MLNNIKKFKVFFDYGLKRGQVHGAAANDIVDFDDFV